MIETDETRIFFSGKRYGVRNVMSLGMMSPVVLPVSFYILYAIPGVAIYYRKYICSVTLIACNTVYFIQNGSDLFV